MKRAIIPILVLMILASAAACRKRNDFPQGWAWGEVTHVSAILWVRGKGPGTVHLKFGEPDASANKQRRKTVRLRAEDDFIGRFQLKDLTPDRVYSFRLWIGDPQSKEPSSSRAGRMRTAPAPDQKHPVRFVFGGDLGGQNACRHRDEGYAVFRPIKRLEPDFFLGLGDMIYADDTCETTGRFGNLQLPDPVKGTNLASFRAKWRYNRSDEHFQALLAETPYEVIWDDHEVINDFHPASTGTGPDYEPGEPLMPAGLRAFREYHPVSPDGPLYRRVRRGANLELFILDNRGYRDPQERVDSKNAPKTMLGREQLAWLKRSLKESNARWKIVVSSVPIAVPTGKKGARDGWADFDGDTGYENELREIFIFLGRENIRTVWLTTDVHFAAVFRHAPLKNRPDFQIHEIITGPLSAGLFPNRDFDDSFAPERLFFHGPESIGAVTEYDDALGWFNFGLVEIDAGGALRASIIDARGKELYELKLEK